MSSREGQNGRPGNQDRRSRPDSVQLRETGVEVVGRIHMTTDFTDKGAPPTVTEVNGLEQNTICALTARDETTTSEVRTCTCRIKIEGVDAFVLIDTGSMVTLVNPVVISAGMRPLPKKPVALLLRSASGHEIPVSFATELDFTFGRETRRHTALVCPGILQDAIIGFDFIRQHDVQINAPDSSIRLAASGRIPLRAAEDWQWQDKTDHGATRARLFRA